MESTYASYFGYERVIFKGEETLTVLAILQPSVAAIPATPAHGDEDPPMTHQEAVAGIPQIYNHDEINRFKGKKKLSSSILLNDVSGGIMEDLMGYLGEPRAMWNILETKYNSATSSKIFAILTSIMNITADKNVGVSSHLSKLEALYCQLVNIEVTNQGRIEVTREVFKS